MTGLMQWTRMPPCRVGLYLSDEYDGDMVWEAAAFAARLYIRSAREGVWCIPPKPRLFSRHKWAYIPEGVLKENVLPAQPGLYLNGDYAVDEVYEVALFPHGVRRRAVRTNRWEEIGDEHMSFIPIPAKQK